MKRFLAVFLLFTVTLVSSTAHAKLAPNERLSLVQLGMAYLEEWDLVKARKVLEQLLDVEPDDTLVRYLKAQVLFHEGDYTGAKKALDSVVTTPVIRGAAEFAKLVEDTITATAGMVKHETEHFIIFYVPGRDDILVPYAAETLEKSYERIGADLQWKPAEKVRVEIYPDSDRFTAVTTLTKKEIETSGTIALCKFNRLMITSPRVLARGYGYLDTLTHEYVHYVLSRKTNNQVPLWLHEGVAKFQETRWRSDEIAKLSPTSQSLLAEALATNYFITFDQMYPSLAKLKRAEDTQLAFAQVETMVGMMVRQGGYPMLVKLIETLSKGKTPEEALGIVGGWNSVDHFLTDWKKYLNERGLKPIPGLKILKTQLAEGNESEDSQDLRAIEDKTVKEHLRLGDQLRKIKRPKAAAFEYRKAREAKQGFDPIIMHKLGLAQMLAGDYSGAEKTFHETLEMYPNFGPINRRLGEVYVAQQEFTKARKPLEAALGINPFDPTIHKLLIETYAQLGEKDLLAREQQVFGMLRGAQ
jgi:tetratricopeptide (TPR) repeat protein